MAKVSVLLEIARVVSEIVVLLALIHLETSHVERVHCKRVGVKVVVVRGSAIQLGLLMDLRLHWLLVEDLDGSRS